MSRDFRGGFFTNLHSSEGAVITDLSTREKKKKTTGKIPSVGCQLFGEIILSWTVVSCLVTGTE